MSFHRRTKETIMSNNNANQNELNGEELNRNYMDFDRENIRTTKRGRPENKTM